MTVDEKAPLKSTNAGQTYLFCSASCKAKFDKEPGKFTGAAGEKTGKKGGCCA
jgi:YHS domain-containing protein